ncbi:MAG: PEP-CTERM sorting domain-containing protein, partial [Pirellula sp.]
SATNKYTQAANATNLDILFTFKSEDGGGGGGVVPEPSSVAVFGLLSLGSAVAKWRRKRSQLAA